MAVPEDSTLAIEPLPVTRGALAIEPVPVTLGELVSVIGEITDDEQEIVAAAVEMLERGRVRLLGARRWS